MSSTSTSTCCVFILGQTLDIVDFGGSPLIRSIFAQRMYFRKVSESGRRSSASRKRMAVGDSSACLKRPMASTETEIGQSTVPGARDASALMPIDTDTRPLVKPVSPSGRLVNLQWVPIAFTGLILLWLLSGTTGEPDLWGHLRFGLDTLALGRVPTVDPYSFTQDRPMLYHEWLSATIMAIAYRAGGVAGLILLKLSVMLIAFGLVWCAWRHVHPLITLPALIVASLGAAPLTRAVRPQIWTLLGLVLLMTLLQHPLTLKRVLLVGILFMAWANLHGGVILGLGVLGVWCVISAWLAWRETRIVPWIWLLTPVAAAVAIVANPYGLELWRFLLTTVRPGRDITEWQPLWVDVPQLWIPFLTVVLAVGRWRLWPSWPATGVILMLWYLGATVTRIAYLAVPVTILLVAPVVARKWPRASFEWRAPSRAAAAMMLIPLICCALAAYPFVRGPFFCLSIGDQDPAGAARLALTQGPGRLAVWFTWGQYALWHLSPRLKISWDGRRETLYSEEAQQTQKAMAFGWPEGDRWLASVRPEYVWLPASFHARRDWLTSNGYRLDHQTSVSFIAVREDLPVLRDAAPFGRCVQ